MTTADGARVCAVTGVTGFLGGYVARALEDRGWRVAPMTRAEVNFADVDGLANFLRAQTADDLLHLAAHADPTAGDARTFYDVNAFLTENLLEAAARAGLRGRFVLVSATSVYGASGDRPQTEDDPFAPMNHYAASKVLAEIFAGWRRDVLDIAIARPSNCFGVGQNPRYLVAKLVAAFRAREPEIALGDIEIARDFVDVRDAADILVRLVAARGREPRIVNASSGRATSIREILRVLTEITGHAPRIRRDERFVRTGDMRFQACAAAAARALGHVPAHDLRDTLAWMVDA